MTVHRHLFAATALAALSACAPEVEEDPAVGEDSSELAVADDLDYVDVSGTVVSTAPGGFVLDYGLGTVTVELDDWDFNAEGEILLPGDRVIVTGVLDENLAAQRTIEASSVFAPNINTYFYASATDEERFPISTTYRTSDLDAIDLTGTVTSIDGRSFTIGEGAGAITIDTSAMSYDPFDEEGFQKIENGDRVYVWGELDLDLGDAAMEAEGIVTLTEATGPALTAIGDRTRVVAPTDTLDGPGADEDAAAPAEG